MKFTYIRKTKPKPKQMGDITIGTKLADVIKADKADCELGLHLINLMNFRKGAK